MSADPQGKAVPDLPAAESSGSFENRLTRLETHLRYLATKEDLQKLRTHLQYPATKEDLQKLKVWWLGGIIAGMGLAATIAASVAVGVLRIFTT